MLRRYFATPALAALLAGLLALPLTLTLAVSKDLSHDEHQHVAAGMLLAREGLLPYRDFPYLHTPYLVFVYGSLFYLTGHPLLAARSFTALCDALTVSVLVFAVYGLFRNRTKGLKLALSFSTAVLFLTSSLFTYTAGRAWNQDPSVLFFLVSGLLYFAATRQLRAGPFLLLSGLSLGIAIGLRITIAPVTLPFLLGLIYFPDGQNKATLGLLFALGLCVALLPLSVLFVLGPEGFAFGNIEFPRLAVVQRELSGNPRTMTLWRKLRYLIKEVVYPNYPLFLATGVCLVLRWKERDFRQKGLLFLAGLLPFVLLGCLAPSPVFYQYFYILLPVGLFMILFAIASLSDARLIGIAVATLSLCAGLSAVSGVSSYADIPVLLTPARWSPMKIHQTGQRVKSLAGTGKVLTLAPIIPLEGGLSIYPAFGTGPFGWRVASGLTSPRRQAVKLVAPDDLPQFLENQSPGAILTGYEKSDLEAPLIGYARSHGYVSTKLKEKAVLWVRP